ncbi:MAG: hypothetical protein E7362_02950 [Clostridiales bacterium]|nr:hypothetical protein [Clostridiales bacterium]
MIKICVLIVVFSIIILFLRSVNPEIATLALVACGIIVIYVALKYIGQVFGVLDDLVNKTGVDSQLFELIIKITAIGYLVEFSASTVEDLGFPSLAQKLVFVGKLVILIMALPIIYAIFNMMTTLLQ